jgi:NADPH-dependent curcumin reductase CurA
MTTPTKTRVVLFTKRPHGKVDESSFRTEERPAPNESELKDGQVLCKLEYLSVDPYLRGKMTGVKTYTDPFNEGDVMQSPVVCRVLKSRSSKLKEGELVGCGNGRWAEYQILDESKTRPLLPGVDPEAALSTVGMVGLTAYFGLLRVGKLREKDTVVVTSAAGGVGYIVGCIAKLRGCRVVGIVGSDEKIKFLKDLGFDGALNYRQGRLDDELRRVCPDGVDVFFDNVGGEIGDLIRQQMRTGGRVVQCGAISQYNLVPGTTPPQGPRQEFTILSKRLTWKGFMVHDFHEHFDPALKELAQWYREGKIPKRVTLFHGLQEAPRALITLFEGHPAGKTLVKI